MRGVASLPSAGGWAILAVLVLESGQVLANRYRVDRPLGSGSMGEVYLAYDSVVEEPVAIKRLAHKFWANQELRERFIREARSVAKVHHPNVVRVTNLAYIGTDEPIGDGDPWYVMEYLDGEDLQQTLAREGPLEWARARRIAMQICAGLQAAHEAGIIHRDVKPANCFRVTRHGRSDSIKMLDFGIAKIDLGDDQEALTAAGVIMGTAEYMAPEQARSRELDARADVYSVGAILFHMLTGQPPFRAKTAVGLLSQHVNAERPVPSKVAPERGITPEQDAIVMTAMAVDREQRFTSAGAMREVLEELVPAMDPQELAEFERERRRRRMMVVGVGVGLFLLGLLGMLAWLELGG
jgi:serine/threonine-protein kinase